MCNLSAEMHTPPPLRGLYLYSFHKSPYRQEKEPNVCASYEADMALFFMPKAYSPLPLSHQNCVKIVRLQSVGLRLKVVAENERFYRAYQPSCNGRNKCNARNCIKQQYVALIQIPQPSRFVPIPGQCVPEFEPLCER